MTAAKGANCHPPTTPICFGHAQKFWDQIAKTLGTVLGTQLDPVPFIAVFGTQPPGVVDLQSTGRRILALTTLLARRLILLRWQHALPHSRNGWLIEILNDVKDQILT